MSTVEQSGLSMGQKLHKIEVAFETNCQSKNVPLTYTLLFLNSLRKKQYENPEEEYKFKMYMLMDEINLIKRGEGFSQQMDTLLRERNQAIRILKAELAGQSKQKNSFSLAFACEILQNIRFYSLMVIENLQKLRMRHQIESATYIEDIISKICNDVDFLRYSQLRKNIAFANTKDPLFIYPLRKFWKLNLAADYNRKPVINFFSIEAEYKQRLLEAEQIRKSIIERPAQAQQEQNGGWKIINTTVEHQHDFQNGCLPVEHEFRSPTKPQYHKNVKRDKKEEEQTQLPSIGITQAIQQYAQPKKRFDKRKIVSNLFRSVVQSFQEDQRDKIKKKSHSMAPGKAKTSSIEQYLESKRDMPKRAAAGKSLQSVEKKPTLPGIPERYQKDARRAFTRNIIQYVNPPDYRLIAQKEEELAKLRSAADTYHHRLKQMHLPQTTNQTQPEKDLAHLGSHQYPFDYDHGEKIRMRGQRKFNNPRKSLKFPEQRAVHTEASDHGSLAENRNRAWANNPSPSFLIRISEHKESNRQSSKESMSLNKSPVRTSNLQVGANTPNSKRYQTEDMYSDKISAEDKSSFNRAGQSQSSVPNSYRRDIELARRGSKNTIDKDSKSSPKHQNSLNAQKPQKQPLKFDLKESDSFSKIGSKKKRQFETNIPSGQKETGNQSPKAPNQSRRSQQNIVVENKKPSVSKIIFEPSNPSEKARQNQAQSNIDIFEEKGVTDQNKMADTSNVVDRESSIDLQNAKKIKYLPKVFIGAQQTRVQVNNAEKTVYQSNSSNSQANSPLKKNPMLQSLELEKGSFDNANKGTSETVLVRKNDSILHRQSPDKQQSVYQASSLPQKIESVEMNPQIPPEEDEKINDKRIKAQVSLNKAQMDSSVMNQSISGPEKCTFKSQSIREDLLLNFLSKQCTKNNTALQKMLTKGYFHNRQIGVTLCHFGEEMTSLCIFHPKITIDSRSVFILHFEVINQKYFKNEESLFNTAVKYIFTNDPCERIVYLRNRRIQQSKLTKIITSSKYFVGEVATPVKGVDLSDTSLLLTRKSLACIKNELYTTVMDCCMMIATTTNSKEIKKIPNTHIFVSQKYLQSVSSLLLIKNSSMKKFVNGEQLGEYLKEEELPSITRWSPGNREVVLSENIIEDCLQIIKFFYHSKYIYVTIEYPYTHYFENDELFFLLAKTVEPNKYFLFGDRAYEDIPEIDFQARIETLFEGKQFSSVFPEKNSSEGKVVGVPLFTKQFDLNFDNYALAGKFDLNWKDYIVGGRYISQQLVQSELVPPFFCGLIELDEAGKMKFLYGASILDENLVQ